MLYLSQGLRFRKGTHVKQEARSKKKEKALKLNKKKARTNLYQEQYSILLTFNQVERLEQVALSFGLVSTIFLHIKYLGF